MKVNENGDKIVTFAEAKRMFDAAGGQTLTVKQAGELLIVLGSELDDIRDLVKLPQYAIGKRRWREIAEKLDEFDLSLKSLFVGYFIAEILKESQTDGRPN
jgi:hypothetical protein